MQSTPPRTERQTVPTQRAFTLPELLVTMGIISLLMSIMLPSLGAARDNAKKCACLAHMKNIATTSMVYASDDAQDLVIPVHPLQFEQSPGNPSFIGAYEWGGKSGVGRTDWMSGSPGNILNSRYGTKAGFGPETRPLNHVLYKAGFKDNNEPWFNPVGAAADTMLALDLFKCPADEGPPRAGHCPSWLQNSEQSSYDHFGTSFAANIFHDRHDQRRLHVQQLTLLAPAGSRPERLPHSAVRGEHRALGVGRTQGMVRLHAGNRHRPAEDHSGLAR